MANGKQSYIRLITTSCITACFLLGVSSLAIAKVRHVPARHKLSWESSSKSTSSQYHERAKRNPDARKFSVTREKVARLKRASFLNKRPYQFSTPLMVENNMFIGADAGVFYSIDAVRNKKVWEFQTEGPVQAKAAYADGTVFVGDCKSYVYALDAQTGKENWRAHLDTEIMSTPLVTGNKVYIVDMSGRLYALDARTGAEIWHTGAEDRGMGFTVRKHSSPAYVNGLIIVGTSGGGVIAYKDANGLVAWARQVGDKQSQMNDVDSTPLAVDGKIYVTSADGMLFCMDPTTGNVLWGAEAGGAGDILYDSGRIYTTGSGVLSALDAQSGNIFWQQDLKTPELSAPVAGEHYIAVASTVDKLYLIDTDNGDISYERYIGRGSFGDPIVSGDRLYILANNSSLFSFKIKEAGNKK